MIPYLELQKAAEKWNNRTLFFTDHQTEISFESFLERTQRLAGALEKQGIGKGDVIAVLLPNCVELVELYLAAGALGAIFQPLDIRFRGEELANIVIHTNIKVLVAHEVNVKDVEDALPTSLTKLLVLGRREGWISYEKFLNPGTILSSVPEIDEDEDNAVYLFSSGSTGDIKCIPMTFRQLEYFSSDMIDVTGMGPEDRAISLLPFSHISGPVVVNLCLVSGCSCVLTQNWKPRAIVDCLERYRVSWSHTVPPLGGMILRGKPEEHDLSALRFIALMGAAIPASMLSALEKAIPSCRAIQGYGLTETSPLLTLLPLEYHETKRGSIGRALDNVEIKIVDENGRDVGNGESGELIVRGAKVFSGYLGNPDLTASVFKDGWFYTGDVVRADEEGFYYHLGRKDDVINCGGLMIYPAEVEGALFKHPLVEDAMVYGLVHEKRGSRVAAKVVPSKGGSLNSAELRKFLLRELAHFKIPTSIEIVEKLKRTPTGKPIR